MASREKTELIRQKIIESTDELLYQKGFNLMSFTDIAVAANVPRGNIYYYFKTKDEVLAAVIEHRINNMKLMLENWNHTIDSPLQRLKRYANIPIIEQQRVIKYGCPMGTLNSELGKSQQNLQQLAVQQMDVFKDWINPQFKALCPDKDAQSLSEHLLIRTQGLSVIAHFYNDKAIILREVESIEKWLDSL